MRFPQDEFDSETLRMMRFALETARVRLKIERSAKNELQQLADIIAAHAKMGFLDAEALARQTMRSFRDEQILCPSSHGKE